MKTSTLWTPAVILLSVPLASFFLTQDRTSPVQSGCLSCHAGIQPFAEGKMMKEIRERGRRLGDPEGCVVCHGGTPSAPTKEEAHHSEPQSSGPQRFYPNPANLFVAEYTCGQCHEGYAQRVLKSSTATETERIHRNLCLFALNENESDAENPGKKRFGMYGIEDQDGHLPVAGSETYKELMSSLASEPRLFAEKLLQPPGPIDIAMQAQESQCMVCHNAMARDALEDQHGTGCASCHVPYRKDGRYLGDDPTIDKSQSGKLLLHRLQGTANTKITLPPGSGSEGDKGESFHGILMDNCFICHNDVRKEDLNPIGSVISHYGSRHQTQIGGNMLCQDCHTSVEMHGDGNIPLSSRAQIEVRCEDCHGTVEKAPWELPLGYDGKPGQPLSGSPRGLTREPPDVVGAEYDSKDGYLLTSRGNAFGNVVKDGDQVVLHSATGQELLVPILKQIKQNKTWKSPLSRQAMFEVKAHIDKMECNSCHGDRVQPPCFGCHASMANQKESE